MGSWLFFWPGEHRFNRTRCELGQLVITVWRKVDAITSPQRYFDLENLPIKVVNLDVMLFHYFLCDVIVTIDITG